MQVRAVIFDMDGTIIDSNAIWHDATMTLMARRGVSVEAGKHDELFKLLHGMSIHDACNALKRAHGWDELVQDLVVEKRRIAQDRMRQAPIPFIRGFPEFHASLSAYTVSSAVATNADREVLASAADSVNLYKFFGEHLYSVSHVHNRGKPLPDIYLYAAAQLGVPVEQCVAVEDSFHGVHAAKAAGMYCIGINSGGDRTVLRYADRIVDHYEQLSVDMLRLV